MSAELVGAGPAIRILIVDDEGDNLEIFALILEWEGFVVTKASSGEEALAAVSLQLPDLILLDVMMPGMNGYEVVERLRASAASRHVPVMLVSAISDGEARPRALAAGADEYLSKPFDRATLVDRVKELLRRTTATTTAVT